MPPPKSRVPLDDSRSETSSTREKLGTVAGVASNGKGRRVASGLGAISSLRDTETSGPVSATTNVMAGIGSVIGHDGNSGVSYCMYA
jgi:hypothetical protein